MAADRISDLPDDLLRHILRFAPAREGASTAVLSRRWRSLWHTSGAVNLDSRSYDRAHGGRFSFAKRDDFFRGAEAALAAAAPVKRLTVHVVEAVHWDAFFLYLRAADGSERDLIGAVLSHAAARHVEELCIRAHRPGIDPFRTVFYDLNLGALPSTALRVLHIVNCRDLAPAPLGATASFPLLSTVQLQGSCVWLMGLRVMVAGAPQLKTLQLESTELLLDQDETLVDDGSPSFFRLCCPGVTALELQDCDLVLTGWRRKGVVIMEIDAPRLQYFRFRGSVQQFRLKSPPSNVNRADLHLIHDANKREQMRVSFWQFIQKFLNTNVLKLNVDYPIEHIAVADKKMQDDLLISFQNLKRLELEVKYKSSSKGAALAMANLLHCCPVVCKLRIQLNNAHRAKRSASFLRCSIEMKGHLYFDKSVNPSSHHRTPLSGDHGDYYGACNMRGLSEHSVNCSQSYVRRVSLQFSMSKLNCFGVQLAKLFTENEMVLEEVHTENGSRKMCKHMNRKVRNWFIQKDKVADYSLLCCDNLWNVYIAE